jgi:hypothetical protein
MIIDLAIFGDRSPFSPDESILRVEIGLMGKNQAIAAIHTYEDMRKVSPTQLCRVLIA